MLLCCAMVLPYLPAVVPSVPAEAVAPSGINNFDVGDDFEGLNLSIIGDSISTFDGYSNSTTYNPLYNSTTAATFNPYYDDDNENKADRAHIAVGDTWWMQTAEALGMNLLVNNSWSGSRVMLDYADGQTTLTNGNFYRSDGTLGFTSAGYKDRCVNLHKGTKNPDIIAVFLGTNDVNWTNVGNSDTRTNAVGSKADVDTTAERTALYTSISSYATPATSVEAYYIMISRMAAKYPNAEIYCMTPMRHNNPMNAGRTAALADFNEAVYYITGLFDNVHFVDLDSNCGMTDEDVVKDYYYLPNNNLHPDTTGMDAISNCLLSEILKNSSKPSTNSNNTTGVESIVDVTYSLDSAFSTAGLSHCAVLGKPFLVNLLPYEDYLDIELTVTMGGEDVTAAATSGDAVYIANVTGPITITAKADKGDFFSWVATADDLASVYGDGYTYNHAAIAGTGNDYEEGTDLYTGTLRDGAYVGTMNRIYYSLEQSIVLQHDKPWVVEWKMDSMQSGMLLMSNANVSSTTGNRFLFLAGGGTECDLVFFGTYNSTDSYYENYGAEIENGVFGSSTPHIYRLYNVVADDGSNMVYASVGLDADSMSEGKPVSNVYKNTTSQYTESDWVVGQDFVFNYFGTTTHELCANIEYIKVWETGSTPAAKTEFNDYRWELNEDRDGFISVDDSDEFTENYLTTLSGSISEGEFTESHFALDDVVVLKHDQPWDMEWVSEGSWRDTNTGAMLFGTSANYKGSNAPYLYRRHSSEIIAFGEWDNNQHNNYGVKLSDYGVDGTIRHKYRLSNVVNADGSNMVYLYVDDVLLDAMDNYYVGGLDKKQKSDWVSGKDFVFSYIGVSYFPIGSCELEYLQVWEKGSFLYTLNTERLQALLDSRLSQNVNGSDVAYEKTSWAAYEEALSNGQVLLDEMNRDTTQTDIDNAVEEILRTMRELVVDVGQIAEIKSVELVTGSYARIGKQVGLRVITSANINAFAVDDEQLLVYNCRTQVLKIDGEMQYVKVWLLTWQPDVTTACTVDHTITAYIGTTAAVTASKSIAYS